MLLIAAVADVEVTAYKVDNLPMFSNIMIIFPGMKIIFPGMKIIFPGV
jgi:hypothetical protein